MSADLTLKRNDRTPSISSTLEENGSAVDLSGTSVKFLMRNAVTGVEKVNAAATIDDAVNGQVSYAWADGDTDTAGVYQAEWEVTFAGGTKATFPNSGYLNITILEDVA